jgi:hypothetical protein
MDQLLVENIYEAEKGNRLIKKNYWECSKQTGTETNKIFRSKN